MKKVGIYGIHNKRTDEWYIGQSHDILSRWKYHKGDLKYNRHHSFKLQNAWNLYKPKSFEFVILEEFESLYLMRYNEFRLKVMLYFREKYYMDKYNALINGYNIEDTFSKIVNYTSEIANKEYDNVHSSDYVQQIEEYKYLYSEPITQQQIEQFIAQ